MENELRTKIETKLREVAKILNCDIELKDKEYSPNILGVLIFKDAIINFHTDDYRSKDKIKFYIINHYKTANGRNEYLRSYHGIKDTSVNISYNKSVDQIAKDIVNRILQDAKHDYKILQDKIKSENDYLNRIENNKNHAKLLNFDTDRIPFGSNGKCWHKIKGINLELETFSDEYKLMVRIDSKEKLSQLMELINKIIPDKK